MFTEQEVIGLMMTSRSPYDWNDNCDKVKAAFNGEYPEFWFKAIIDSGVMSFVHRGFK